MTREELTALRIPVSSDVWPQIDQGRRVAVVVIMQVGNPWSPGLAPTEAEAGMIASFIDYQLAGSSLSLVQVERMRETEPFDTWDRVPYMLCHRGEAGWKYNRPTWTVPLWAPVEGNPLTLTGLLDHIEASSSRWAEWKQAHPEVFTP